MADFKILQLSEEFYLAAVNFFLNSLLPDENLAKTLRTMTDPTFPDNNDLPQKIFLEFQRLYLSIFKENIWSFIALDVNNNEVLGVIANQIRQEAPSSEQPRALESGTPVYKTPTVLALMEVISQIEERFNPFEHFNAECGIEIIAISTLKSARGRGIAKALFKKSVEAVEEYKGYPKPKFLYSYFTSRISLAAGRSAIGMEPLMVIPYTDLKYKEQSLAPFAPPDAPSISIAGLKCSSNLSF